MAPGGFVARHGSAEEGRPRTGGIATPVGSRHPRAFLAKRAIGAFRPSQGPLGGGPFCTFARVAQSEEGVRAAQGPNRQEPLLRSHVAGVSTLAV